MEKKKPSTQRSYLHTRKHRELLTQCQQLIRVGKHIQTTTTTTTTAVTITTNNRNQLTVIIYISQYQWFHISNEKTQCNIMDVKVGCIILLHLRTQSHLNIRDICDLIIKGYKIFHTNAPKKKPDTIILISYKIDLKAN